MKENGQPKKVGSVPAIVFLTAVLTLLLAGGASYFMGYLRAPEPGRHHLLLTIHAALAQGRA